MDLGCIYLVGALATVGCSTLDEVDRELKPKLMPPFKGNIKDLKPDPQDEIYLDGQKVKKDSTE